jgi:hypothetical protein
VTAPKLAALPERIAVETLGTTVRITDAAGNDLVLVGEAVGPSYQFAAEIVRRWNMYDGLSAACKEAEETTMRVARILEKNVCSLDDQLMVRDLLRDSLAPVLRAVIAKAEGVR